MDDTVCRKYSPNTEMACYNYSSTQGKILSHDYVTSVYHNDQIKIPDNIKLYGSKKKCEQKKVPFKTKIELACEIIDEHTPLTKQTIMHWDSWYTCSEVVKHCKDRGYRWIGDIKSNRVVYYQGEKFALSNLYDLLCEEGKFVDVVVNGELFLVCGVKVYVAEIGDVVILINVKAGTRDLHFLCSDLLELSVFEFLEMALKRHVIEEVHKEVKALGLGEYQFQRSEAALIHAHLVCLAFVLLYILRLRLLRYGTKKTLLTTDAAVKWVRGQAGGMFVHMIRESKESTKSLLWRINTK
ncbi:transposase [Candidatus Bathycorpusculum sp.]|uniref:transposase n=1 Tax=Candidatus Bathycorpusculum sp. TaxID=2994959 RepID=UPI0031CC7B0A